MTIDLEKQICEALVDAALAKVYRVSVYDGMEFAIRKSVDRAAIIEAMYSTCSDVLTFHDTAGRNVGCVVLIYGNGIDVISDYSANAEMDALVITADG